MRQNTGTFKRCIEKPEGIKKYIPILFKGKKYGVSKKIMWLYAFTILSITLLCNFPHGILEGINFLLYVCCFFVCWVLFTKILQAVGLHGIAFSIFFFLAGFLFLLLGEEVLVGDGVSGRSETIIGWVLCIACIYAKTRKLNK